MAGKLHVFRIGRPLRGPWAEIAEEFLRRAGRYAELTLTELRPSSSRQARERRRAEGEALATRLPRHGVRVALDIGGRSLDSQGFQRALARWRERGGASFIVGGADGLAGSVVEACDERVSLGGITLTHDLALIVLLEQIYRALAAGAGHPYAKH